MIRSYRVDAIAYPFNSDRTCNHRTSFKAALSRVIPDRKLRLAALSMSCLLAVAGTSTAALAQISFSNVTDTQLNPARTDRFYAESWGLTVGDVEGDFWPDVYVPNHRMRPSYYRNNGDGTLIDNTLQVDASHVFTTSRYEDRHGAAFSDIDGDGDSDLLSMQAGRGFSFRTHQPVFVANSEGRLVDEGQQRGLAHFWGNSNAWLDINGDGFTDAMNGTGTDRYYLQDAQGDFGSRQTLSGCRSQWYTVSDVNDDQVVDLLCGDEGTFPGAIFSDFGTNSNNIASDVDANGDRIFPVVANVVDSIAADINNDLQSDLIFVRGSTLPNQVKLISPNRLEAMTDSGTGRPLFSFRFQSSDEITVTFNTSFTGLYVMLGDSGDFIRDSSVNKLTVTLDPSDTRLHDPETNPSSNRRYYVSYDPATSTWEIVQSATSWWVSYLEIDSASAMTNLQVDATDGYSSRDLPITPFLLQKQADGFVDQTFASGLAVPIECNSLAAADLDNDMDQDLVFVCGRGVENLANRIFENQGDGSFVEVANHGAEGVIGAGTASRAGNSESVVTADFNNDGFLDLFVTNGANDQPLRRGGPHELILNDANSNHWVELELVGAQPGSTPDAIGARVIATAGGVSQLREQGGGYHRWSQNHDRVHFGLANNTSVDLQVQWPDGSLETYSNVAADQLYVIEQTVGINAVTLSQPGGYAAPVSGDECGVPGYWTDRDQGLFIYRDCASGTWSMRSVSGGAPLPLTVSGRITSDANVQFAAPVLLEPSDVVDITTDAQQLAFSFTTSDNTEDGVNFGLATAASGCLSLDTPANLPVLIGPDFIPATLPINIADMTSCQPATATPLMTIATQSFSEGDGTIAVEVTLDAPSSTVVTAEALTTNAGSAQGGQDFFGIAPQLISFAVGQTQQSFNITLLDDAAIESDESIVLVLRNLVGARLGDVNPAIIVDDDTGNVTPTVSIQAQSFAEGDGLVDVDITLDVAPAAGQTVSVDFFTSFLNSTASPGADYNGVAVTTVTFDGTAAETSKTVSVNLLQDSLLEGDETVTLRLINVNGAIIGTIEPLTIIDDDTSAPASEISVPAQSFSEADGTVQVRITLDVAPPDGEQVTAQVYTTRLGSTAIPGVGNDYFGVAPIQVVFIGDAGAVNGGDIEKTVDLTILQDSVDEPTETIVIRLINVAGASVGNVGVISIIDDD